MLVSAIGISDDIDDSAMVTEVVEQCSEKLGGLQPQLGILFGSNMDADYQGLLQYIIEHFPQMQLVGCTTDGEITSQCGVSEDSLALLALYSDDIEFATALAENISEDAEKALTKAYSDARAKLSSTPQCAFLLPDGITSISTAFDSVIHEAFGENFPVFGGCAGDHFKFHETLQFYGNAIHKDSIPIIVLGGAVTIDVATQITPEPICLRYAIGRHERNIVYEIDNQPALSFYQKQLGIFNKQAIMFPLAVLDEDDQCLYFRSPIDSTPDTGSLTLIGTLPEQCSIRLSLTSRNDILSRVQDSTKKLLDSNKEPGPELLLIFACTSIRYTLGSRVNELLTEVARKHIPFFGFFCYGEIGPSTIGGKVNFHSDSCITVSIRSNPK